MRRDGQEPGIVATLRGIEDRLTPILSDTTWQMSTGERAAMEGMLSQLSPELAIEIGTAEGASLRRVAAHSKEVHSFDLVEPELDVDTLGNVTLHTGDSHQLLPELLAELASQERNVDFVLVDGDHSAKGVNQDIEDLLDSPAIGKTIILIHDITNEEVRRGLDSVRYGAWPKVEHVDLDFVPGYLFKEDRLLNELWGGLGLVVVDASRLAYGRGDPMQQRVYPAAQLFARVRDQIVAEQRAEGSSGDAGSEETADEVMRLRAEIEHQRDLQAAMKRSLSWRLTAPLRAAKRGARASRQG